MACCNPSDVGNRQQPLNEQRCMLLKRVQQPFVDPLVAEVSSEPVIAELRGDDPSKVITGYGISYCVSCVCLLPCFLQNLIICAICAPFCALKRIENQVTEFASATQIILTQSALIYRIDECVMPGFPPEFGSSLYKAGINVGRFEFSLLLDEEFTLEIIPMDLALYPVETLVIRYKNVVVAAIDGPSDTSEFMGVFEQQRQKAIASEVSSKINGTDLEKHRAALNLLPFMIDGQADQVFKEQFEVYQQKMKMNS